MTLKPNKDDLMGIVVESTFNWYWVVDLLTEEGYRVHLVNPSAIKKYGGLKHRDDKHDALWLAHLLWLGILPEGYLYPKHHRPIRDLSRERGYLEKIRGHPLNEDRLALMASPFFLNVISLLTGTENLWYALGTSTCPFSRVDASSC
jgi:hypothetical protein